jgi:hypothetical protein
MANNPKKLDPAESALNAIQAALGTPEKPTMSRPAPAAYEPVPPPVPPMPSMDQRRTVADKDLFEGVGPSAYDEQPAPRRAANDDRQSIGMILQTLQRHPPRTSYWVATAFAFAWVLGGLILAFLYLPELRTVASQGSAGIPAMFGLGAFILAPVLFFYALAHMVWRSQELRLIAQSMAGVAMRLAEPEEVARESIVTVGQAIRREVAAMGDGVERALARAAELEALVANEVASMERAYHDNEVVSRTSATPWSRRASRSGTPSPACTSISPTTSRRSATTSRTASTTARRRSCMPLPRRASTSRSRWAAPATS